jgi:hypothetical protein
MRDHPASATAGAGRDNHDGALPDGMVVEYTGHDKKGLTLRVDSGVYR